MLAIDVNSTRHRTRPLLLAILALLAVLALTASARPAEAATTIVKVGQTNGGTTAARNFNAASITITVGDTVRWEWFNGAHDVQSAVGPFYSSGTGGSLNSAGAFYQFTFATAGTYTYYCDRHAGPGDADLANIDANLSSKMVGKIVVNPVTGTRTASVANLTLTAKNYSHVQQTSAGTMTLTADDSTGSGAGWNVTIVSSAFVYSGANSGTNIPAANFALTSAAAPVMTAGQAIDPTGGPKVPAVSPVGALNTTRKTIQANAAFGKGAYTQALGVTLTIPAQSRAGTYTGTLTTTIVAGP